VRDWRFPVAALAGTQLAPLLAGVPLLRPLWPRLVGQGRDGHVALTFDDGPDDRGTPEVLDVLAREDVRATFFVLGSMVERHPAVLDRIAAEGHELAVHSWDHRNHLRHPPHVVHHQLARTADLLERRTGVRPRYFRPPYGALTGGAVLAGRRLDLQPVLWTAWGRDWEERATGDSVAGRVGSGLGSGGTVLLHDSDCTSAPNSWRATVAALPAILRQCRDAGWSIGTVREHLPA
jgi:peptidoglycan/xylan/chitin deacetylase (PgdA/CDA1 family)